MKPRATRHLFRNLALLLIAALLASGGLAYGWVDSIDYNVHKHFQSIENAQNALTDTSPNQPINILILGSDKRYRDKLDPGRSDTLMVLRLDFKHRRVYLVSIPRDSRVHIPGHGWNKINAAYALGGPRLSIRTVEDFTGLRINHYVQIDFRGFKKIVDALGGVDVNVKETINNRSYRYRMYIPRGKQRMDGELALNYVRYRHGDSDFKRAERQQNFLTALTDNILRWSSAWKIPRLLTILSNNIETDLSMSQMSNIGGYLRRMKRKNIETITIPGKTGMRDGASYVFPNEYAVEAIISAIKRGKSLSGLKSNIESGKIGTVDKISVSILNGTGVSGLAAGARYRLRSKGFKVLSIGTAARADYPVTKIIVNTGDLSKARRVKRYLPASALITTRSKKLYGDVLIILGDDYSARQRLD